MKRILWTSFVLLASCILYAASPGYNKSIPPDMHFTGSVHVWESLSSSTDSFRIDGASITKCGTIEGVDISAIPSTYATQSSLAAVQQSTFSYNSNWDTAYTDRLKWDGGSTGLNASTGRTSLSLVPDTDIPSMSSFNALKISTYTMSAISISPTQITAGTNESVRVGTATVSLSCSGNSATATSATTATTATNVAASGITAGTISNSVLVTTASIHTSAGVASNSSFLRGDGQWAAPSGAGDMQKSVYDTGDNGIVDNAEAWNGSSTAAALFNAVMPVGFEYQCGVSTIPPAGYNVLYENGQSVSTTTYSALFAYIAAGHGGNGYYFGGSGANFNIPDARGLGVRGLDDGKGLDSEPYRVIGSTQPDTGQGHQHATGYAAGTSGTGGILTNATASNLGTVNTTAIITDGVNGTPRISSETRIKNRAVAYFIKY